MDLAVSGGPLPSQRVAEVIASESGQNTRPSVDLAQIIVAFSAKEGNG